MKKVCIFLVTAILLSSCSVTLEQVFLLPTKTPTAAPTSTIPPTAIPTLTATIATATFTTTPTLSGERTETPAIEATPTLQTITPLAKITPNTATPTIEMSGFVNVFISDSEFFKTGVCEPKSVKFTAQVGNPASTAFVVLFVRFKSKLTGATSEWTNFRMDYYNIGTFIHNLTAVEMKAVDSFPNAWVQYQFVATDSKLHELGRTGIFSERLALLDCVPSPTPLMSPTPTATVP